MKFSHTYKSYSCMLKPSGHCAGSWLKSNCNKRKRTCFSPGSRVPDRQCGLMLFLGGGQTLGRTARGETQAKHHLNGMLSALQHRQLEKHWNKTPFCWASSRFRGATSFFFRLQKPYLPTSPCTPSADPSLRTFTYWEQLSNSTLLLHLGQDDLQ